MKKLFVLFLLLMVSMSECYVSHFERHLNNKKYIPGKKYKAYFMPGKY
jgi:hypothetical protein